MKSAYLLLGLHQQAIRLLAISESRPFYSYESQENGRKNVVVHYCLARHLRPTRTSKQENPGKPKGLLNSIKKVDNITQTLVLLTERLKVRQIRNDFFKPTFLPKNKQTNSTLLLVDLFSFVFQKKVKTPKRHFKIN